MLKLKYWKTIAIVAPIVFICSGCFTVLPIASPDTTAGGGPPPTPIPPSPPPVIIIHNHFIPPLPDQDPPPPEPERPFDRHEPAYSKDESARPDAERRISREGNNGSADSGTGSSGRRRTRQ